MLTSLSFCQESLHSVGRSMATALSSERELQRKLDLAFRSDAGALQLAEVTVGEVVVRVDELRSVGQVIELRPELQVVALPELEVLEGREVSVIRVWTYKIVTGRSATAQFNPGVVLGNRGKGCWIEVLKRGRDSCKRATHEVWPNSRTAAVVEHVEWCPAVGGEDQVCLPATQNCVFEAIPVGPVLHTLAER